MVLNRLPCTYCDGKIHVKQGQWTEEEDRRLISYILLHGERKWKHVPEAAGIPRCGRSCRSRWFDYLRPTIKHGKFSDEEEEQMIRLYNVFGSRWSFIAQGLPGRTPVQISNHWKTKKMKKKVFGRVLEDYRGRNKKKVHKKWSPELNLELSLCSSSSQYRL